VLCPKNIAWPLAVWLHFAMLPLAQDGKCMNIGRRRLQIFYSGHVQGVGFRYTVKTVSAGFDVMGTVRNLPDGRVELVAEGEVAELKAFQEAIRDEGLGSLIRDEQVDWSDAQGGLRGFEISR
jgi:acylphosphatase